MIKRFCLLALAAISLFIQGCVKETYDMTKLSEEVRLSPSLAIPGPRGEVLFSDIVKANDTVLFDDDNFVRLVFRQDSVINLQLEDYYDLNDMVNFRQSYQFGVISIGSFQSTLTLTLNQITQSMSSATRNQISALDDGATHLFPAFPSVNLGDKPFPAFPGFDNAVFQSGYLDISLTNNLTAPLSGATLNLYNSSDNSAIGSVTLPEIPAGQTIIRSVDLADKRVKSALAASIVLSGSSGTSTPVIISLNNSSISVLARGRDLKVKSGRIVIPSQRISSLDEKDTITFDPGEGIEIEKIRINAGNVSYKLTSTTSLASSFTITLPTAIKNSAAITKTISAASGTVYTGTIDFSSSVSDLGTDPAHPFDRIPMQYTLNVNSGGVLVNFNSTDKIELELSLKDPDIDYVKGYFSQISETIEPDTLDLDIDEILNSLTGEFLISNPIIRLNYSNSFAIPLKVDFQATGSRDSRSVNLGLDPIMISYPQYPESRDISSVITIDRDNSDLPELISLPPGKVVFSGSAAMNPDGNTGARDNYVFGDSRFLASAEVEVPLEFRMNNLQFADTIDNFLKLDEDDDSPVKPENFKSLELLLTATNYFPLGVGVRMGLYDEDTGEVLSDIDASKLLEAAPVNQSGKSSGFRETKTTFEIDQDFFDAIKSSEKIIIWFTLNTSSSGTVDVKIYSDYKIGFRTSVVAKPEIIFN